MNMRQIVLGIIVIVIGLGLFTSMYTVDQREQAIVLEFGEPVRDVKDPGLHFKWPYQSVVAFDNRILDLDPPTEEVVLSDQKRIIIDAFARYRIVDPLRFYKSVATESRLRDRLGATLNSALRNVAGLHPLIDLLSPKRDDIMGSIQKQVSRVAADAFGIQIVDVRISRSDLPAEISANVYERMRSERTREANQLRAEGDEAKQTITAQADRERIAILAEANREAQVLRGEGDAEANTTLAQAYGKAPDFFAFYRSMQAYRSALGSKDTTMVLSPDSDFFRYFGNIEGKSGPAPAK
jgi:membrane protease subunit HflC